MSRLFRSCYRGDLGYSIPHVLVVEVVGVLPDIHREDGGLAIGDGVASADGLVDHELGAVPRQPCPAGTKGSVTLPAQQRGGLHIAQPVHPGQIHAKHRVKARPHTACQAQ